MEVEIWFSRIQAEEKQSCARLVILLALVFTFLSFAKPGAAQLGGKPEKSNLTISYTQASGAFTPLWVAQEAGLFKKYGLDATLKILNSQVAHQALIAGEVDVISSGPELVNARLQGVPVKYIGGSLSSGSELVNARLQGAPVKYIGGSLQQFVFQLWGRRLIPSPI